MTFPARLALVLTALPSIPVNGVDSKVLYGRHPDQLHG